MSWGPTASTWPGTPTPVLVSQGPVQRRAAAGRPGDAHGDRPGIAAAEPAKHPLDQRGSLRDSGQFAAGGWPSTTFSPAIGDRWRTTPARRIIMPPAARAGDGPIPLEQRYWDVFFAGVAWPSRVQFLRDLIPRLDGLKIQFLLPDDGHLRKPDLPLPECEWNIRLGFADRLTAARYSKIVLYLERRRQRHCSLATPLPAAGQALVRNGGPGRGAGRHFRRGDDRALFRARQGNRPGQQRRGGGRYDPGTAGAIRPDWRPWARRPARGCWPSTSIPTAPHGSRSSCELPGGRRERPPWRSGGVRNATADIRNVTEGVPYHTAAANQGKTAASAIADGCAWRPRPAALGRHRVARRSALQSPGKQVRHPPALHQPAPLGQIDGPPPCRHGPAARALRGPLQCVPIVDRSAARRRLPEVAGRRRDPLGPFRPLPLPFVRIRRGGEVAGAA